MRAISLDVGPSRLILAEGNTVGRDVHIEKVFPVDLPMGSIADGIISDHASVRSALGVTLKANKVRSRSAVVVVNSNALVLRKIEVPSASERDMRNLANVEMQQFLPSGKRFMVDFVTLSETVSPHGGKMCSIRAAALPYELCDGYYRVLQETGMKPEQLEILPHVLEILFSPESHVNDKLIGAQPLIVVDLSQFQTSINVILNGEAELSRSLPVGIANMERMVADRMQISPEEARTLIRTGIDIQKDETEVIEPIRRFYAQIVQEIRKVQQYLRTRNAQETARVFLYGVGSGIKGLDAHLSEAVEAEVETIRSHSRIHLPVQEKAPPLGHFLNAAGALLKA